LNLAAVLGAAANRGVMFRGFVDRGVEVSTATGSASVCAPESDDDPLNASVSPTDRREEPIGVYVGVGFCPWFPPPADGSALVGHVDGPRRQSLGGAECFAK
jgi:hypothetical protein